jgi:hypothetical protein
MLFVGIIGFSVSCSVDDLRGNEFMKPICLGIRNRGLRMIDAIELKMVDLSVVKPWFEEESRDKEFSSEDPRLEDYEDEIFADIENSIADNEIRREVEIEEQRLRESMQKDTERQLLEDQGRRRYEEEESLKVKEGVEEAKRLVEEKRIADLIEMKRLTEEERIREVEAERTRVEDERHLAEEAEMLRVEDEALQADEIENVRAEEERRRLADEKSILLAEVQIEEDETERMRLEGVEKLRVEDDARQAEESLRLQVEEEKLRLVEVEAFLIAEAQRKEDESERIRLEGVREGDYQRRVDEAEAEHFILEKKLRADGENQTQMDEEGVEEREGDAGLILHEEEAFEELVKKEERHGSLWRWLRKRKGTGVFGAGELIELMQEDCDTQKVTVE